MEPKKKAAQRPNEGGVCTGNESNGVAGEMAAILALSARVDYLAARVDALAAAGRTAPTTAAGACEEPLPELIDLQRASQQLGVRRQQLYRLDAANRLRLRRVGRRAYLHRSDYQRIVEGKVR